MSDINDLGFQSTFVLMKIGYDLKNILEDTVRAPIPENLGARAANIPNVEPDKELILLDNVQYIPKNDRSLF